MNISLSVSQRPATIVIPTWKRKIEWAESQGIHGDSWGILRLRRYYPNRSGRDCDSEPSLSQMPRNQKIRTDKDFAVKTCERLKTFRRNAGFSKSAVAEHLKIPMPLYELYEKYELVPHQLIPSLCELLDFSPWYYLTGMADELSPPFRSDG